MHIQEAQWFHDQIKSLPSENVYPMCNVGSSTEDFRKRQQPYIDSYLFAPARAQNQSGGRSSRRP